MLVSFFWRGASECSCDKIWGGGLKKYSGGAGAQGEWTFLRAEEAGLARAVDRARLVRVAERPRRAHDRRVAARRAVVGRRAVACFPVFGFRDPGSGFRDWELGFRD